MDAGIVRRLAAEDEELARKQDELALLQSELAERELYLTNLRTEISSFEAQYLRRVGTLYAELDEWNAKIAELKAKREATPEAQSAAAEARAQADESGSAVHGEAAAAKEFTPSAELKSLYREVAKRVHPDLATDQADRDMRDRLMKEVNRAFQRGDADTLRKILEEYESSPQSVRGTGVGADLVHLLRQIKQVKDRLVEIELEVAKLAESELAKLKAKADIASGQGRDLLAEMAAAVQGRVNVARQLHEAEAAGKGL
jgi:hypothetical protein